MCRDFYTLRPPLLLQHLNEYFLIGFEHIFDAGVLQLNLFLLSAKTQVRLVRKNITRIEKSVSFQPNVNKSRLHPRQDIRHSAFIDISY